MLRKGGADKRGGAHSRYQFFRCGINRGGGRINDGGRSDGTLRYNDEVFAALTVILMFTVTDCCAADNYNVIMTNYMLH